MEVDEGLCLVSFMHGDVGDMDLAQRTLQPLAPPFGRGFSIE